MNLNQKIKPFTADGIPAYNGKINELINAVNWLMGIRSLNGRPIRESDQGPVIDLSQVHSTQGGPISGDWQTDPNGNKAGWMQVIVFDPDYATNGKSDVCWIWTGGALSQPAIPWMTDPSGLPAGWIVCAQPTFWGTGTCPVGAGNYQTVHFIFNGPTGVSPATYTGNASNPPITPPTSPPAVYFIQVALSVSWNVPNAPYLIIVTGATPTNPTVSVSYTFTVTYDGTQIFSISGSATGNYSSNQGTIFIALDPSIWLYDPGGLPGYAHGNKQWIWQYNGPISSNTNPTIVQTFTYSASFGACSILNWNANLLIA